MPVMKVKSPESIVNLYQALQQKMSPHLPEKIGRTSLFVDIADAYEACNSFSDVVEDLVSRKRMTRDQLQTALVDVDLHLLEHLTYHLKSLRKHLPKAIAALEEGRRAHKE
jgi:hypothetical protein